MKRIVLGATLCLAGCASTSPQAGFRDVNATIEKRSGHTIRWTDGSTEDEQVTKRINVMLAGELDVDRAVQIALLRNRKLLATFEDLSVAQAELVQAGLLKNPVFSASVATAERDTLSPPVLFNVVQDFLDIFMLPARKKVAASQVEQIKLRVSDAVLDLACEVRNAYYMHQSATQVAAVRRMIAESAQNSLDLATRQHDAGNISDLALANERRLYEQMKLDLARSQVEVLTTREHLTRLMGLWGEDAAWKLSAKLPVLPKDEVSFDKLESLAVTQRLDLASARQEVQTLSYLRHLMGSTRWTGVISVGVEAGILKNGDLAVGPNIALELPIFNQGQGAVARLEAMLRASEHRYAGKAIDVRSEVRAARGRMIFAKQIAEHYQTVFIPVNEEVVRLSQEQYDSMLLGVFQLLSAKRDEVNAYRDYVEAVRDYWIAHSDLERAVGSRLETHMASATPVAATPAAATPRPAAPPAATPNPASTSPSTPTVAAPAHHH